MGFGGGGEDGGDEGDGGDCQVECEFFPFFPPGINLEYEEPLLTLFCLFFT